MVAHHTTRELSTEQWKNVIDRIADYGVRCVTLLGGEPTLRKDLPELVKHASLRAAVTISTNGDEFKKVGGKDYLKLLARNGLSAITFSLHSFNDLEWQLALLGYAREIGVIPIMAAVATKKSLEYLPGVMEKANEQGIFFRYSFVQNVGQYFSLAAVDVVPTSEQVAVFTDQVRNQKKKSKRVQNTHEYLCVIADMYPCNWHCDPSKDHWVVVDSQGNLMACSEWPTEISVLDVRSLEDVYWQQTRKYLREQCRGCTHHCYIEEEQTNRLALAREVMERIIGLYGKH